MENLKKLAKQLEAYLDDNHVKISAVDTTLSIPFLTITIDNITDFPIYVIYNDDHIILFKKLFQENEILDSKQDTVNSYFLNMNLSILPSFFARNDKQYFLITPLHQTHNTAYLQKNIIDTHKKSLETLKQLTQYIK